VLAWETEDICWFCVADLASVTGVFDIFFLIFARDRSIESWLSYRGLHLVRVQVCWWSGGINEGTVQVEDVGIAS
jgi:hypothetical protein